MSLGFPDILSKIGLNSGRSRLDVAAAAAQTVLPQTAVVNLVAADDGAAAAATPDHRHIAHHRPTAQHKKTHDQYAPKRRTSGRSFGSLPGFFRGHIVITTALVILLVGTAVIRVGADVWSARIIPKVSAAQVAKLPAKPIVGFNVTVPAAELQSKIQAVTSQPATLSVGSFSEQLSPDIIKSWLQITANKQKTEYYIHVNEAAMDSSLLKEAQQYERTPINQVTVSEDGTSRVVVGGKDGRALSDPNTLKTQVAQNAKDVMNDNGIKFSTPMADAPFKAVTAANFDKLIVADITTKKMWAYQNGNQVNSWLVSAGAPDTPTPVGEFHVYAKYTSQDMWGYGPGHKYYFQPHVHWVNYFYEGSAIHGVYWHPISWFGAINSSHGCIGVPDYQAQWIYDWLPIGTTVIVHT